MGFSFATLQAFGKTPCEIERLQSTEMGFANMLAPSFKKPTGKSHCVKSVQKQIFFWSLNLRIQSE